MAQIQGPVGELGRAIEQVAGSAASQAVMQGSGALSDKSKPAVVAEWVKSAMLRLDETVAEAERKEIMARCGQNCAAHNPTPIQRAAARRKKFTSEEEFLAAEVRKPGAGTRLEREGNVLYQYYTPQSFSHPMRCYCGLLRGLPQDEAISRTYCECSRAFVQKMWETALDRPLQVDLLGSCVAGDQECKFAIHLERE
jgi:hypothetical protein